MHDRFHGHQPRAHCKRRPAICQSVESGGKFITIVARRGNIARRSRPSRPCGALLSITLNDKGTRSSGMEQRCVFPSIAFSIRGGTASAPARRVPPPPMRDRVITSRHSRTLCSRYATTFRPRVSARVAAAARDRARREKSRSSPGKIAPLQYGTGAGT